MGTSKSRSVVQLYNDSGESSRERRTGPTSRRSVQLNLWKGRQLTCQLCGCVRHCERADWQAALVRGERWQTTDDGKRWPTDPPLSDAGVEASFEVGRSVLRFTQSCDTEIHVIISSPYYRCLQTAISICSFLPRARLLIDNEIGEVFGPSVMGPVKPVHVVRPAEETSALLKSIVPMRDYSVVGIWPTWPEDLSSARQRQMLRFLSYLRRGVQTRRNFLLVSHGDGVGAALSIMPSYVGEKVMDVAYGGSFFACRHLERPSSVAGESCDAASAGSEFCKFMEGSNASTGWRVQISGIRTSRRRSGDWKQVEKKAKRLARCSSFSACQILDLLGNLSPEPLGLAESDMHARPPGMPLLEDVQDVDWPTHCSITTLLFGGDEESSDQREYSAACKTRSQSNGNGRSAEGQFSSIIPVAMPCEFAQPGFRVGKDQLRETPGLLESGSTSTALGSSSFLGSSACSDFSQASLLGAEPLGTRIDTSSDPKN